MSELDLDVLRRLLAKPSDQRLTDAMVNQLPEIIAALEWNARARALISYLHRELQDSEIGGDEVLPAERALLRLAGIWPEEDETDG